MGGSPSKPTKGTTVWYVKLKNETEQSKDSGKQSEASDKKNHPKKV